MKRFIIFCLTYLISNNSFACSSAPEEHLVPELELINRTNNIVLAVVSRAELQGFGGWTKNVKYTFKTVKVIKGHADAEFNIFGGELSEGSMNGFNDHKKESFWNDWAGREYSYPDCKIKPGFAVGATYLIFLDPPFHRKSFELIWKYDVPKENKDKWLQYVEQNVASNR